ncbi:Auxin-responsive family protein [Perilla frutescens var. hirtella]|nr:Auxin-responsive family protein [Perilla frutescens var. hirtella]KAH6785164.1 hypothetical protein C2S51_037619 [Perilla frutescens var. frutescens]
MEQKTHVVLLFSALLLTILLIGSSNAQSSCSSYAFSNGRSFVNCSNLPVLNASIHWNYHQSNRSVDIAYRHEQITDSNWIAWALNPSGGGMIGAQSLVAFVAPNGSIRAYTSPITSYNTALQEGPLSFDVPAKSAEFVNNNQIIIYATIQLPQGNATSFTQLWQHGDLSGGTPRPHPTTGDHLRSSGTIDFATGDTGASAPCPPPDAAPTVPTTPTTPTTANNCPPHSFSGGRTYSDCNSLPVLNAFLHWNYEQSSNSIEIAYRHTGVTTSNWVAWALNPNGGAMIGAQSLVALAAPNGSIRAYTSPITSYSTTLQEGPLSFEVPSISAEFVDNNQMIIYATIQLPQGSSSFTQLWQHGDVSGGVPQAHPTTGDNLRSVGNINFATGSTTAGGAGGGSRQRKRNVHGVLNVASWGILMPVGAMAARYLKVFKSANPAWFYIHVTCQTSAYIVGVAGWGTGMKLGSDSAGVEHTTHRNIGITLFALGTLQVFALLLRPKPDHKYRLYWNIYHQSVGYAVIALSIANIFEGFDILDPEKKWKNAYIGVLIFLGAAAALLEAFTWFIVLKRKRDSAKNPHQGTTNGNGYHA